MEVQEPPRLDKKLDCLYGETKFLGRVPRTHRELANVCGHPGANWVSNNFGHGVRKYPSGDILRIVCNAFCQAGVAVMPNWFELSLEEFRKVVREARAAPGEWEFTETSVLPDLVELRLLSPRPGNEMRDSYYLDATLLFGTALCDYEPEGGDSPRTISIALSNARLSMGSDRYRPIPDSMIGERPGPNHCKRVAGGVEIFGPSQNGALDGSPIADQHLVVIAETDRGTDPFVVAVAANRGSFIVADSGAPPECLGANGPNDNKNAILNALIYKTIRKDDQGRAVLARATTTRKPKHGGHPS